MAQLSNLDLLFPPQHFFHRSRYDDDIREIFAKMPYELITEINKFKRN
ncbi:hypothetical protein QUF82_01970 [Thiotrichales bacterium HSG14]|nr:hypothetical protein [Thiotrichales bacterium HSG14]